MRHDKRDAYHAWLWGEALVFTLLGGWLAIVLAFPDLPRSYALPQTRLVLDTIVTVAATIVAVLAGVRFSVEGRRLDLLLSSGFFVAAASTLAFAIAPVLGGQPLHRVEAWAGVAGRLLSALLIAAAPFAPGRFASRERAVAGSVTGLAIVLFLVWLACRSLGSSLPPFAAGGGSAPPNLLVSSLAILALLRLLAVLGFGIRFRKRREDLDRWLALAATLALFAELRSVFTPLLTSEYVTQGDFLTLLGHGVLLVGVWRAISHAEFGRAVAEERARVAREIHDGLAQYLFAVSTHASMLESGAPLEPTVARLKEAAVAAQQEARFAVLALSSAGGTASFDAALRRYVDFLTADGLLEVDLEIDSSISLAPDEQIEVFRIVQEGLANVRKHANARCAQVTIAEREGRRLVSIRDDGEGFNSEAADVGQGLKNIRQRTASIEGGFALRSKPGYGTALEVTLRA